ncbi:MAG: ATPase, T2SS/T4P/T4SS family, partial [Verrucomicrobiota bacterium]|nr:ATPase, T2SS/T4P/T4SS family [Verrucomicrobiota bacterium]
MNPTDEYLLEAFSEQGVVNDAMLAEIRQAVDAQSEEEVGDKDLSFMNLVLEKTGTHETDVVNFLASELNMESVDLAEVNPPEEILALLSPEWARQYEAFPLGVSGAEIEIVFGNPLDEDGLDNLTHLLGKTINPKIAYRGAVLHAIDEAYGTAEDRRMNEFFDGMDASEIEIGDGVKPEDVSEEDAPIIKYVHSVIKDALEMRASDIHMEPLEKKFRIRFRVDGKLQEQPDPPKRLQPSIISRTKLMANVSLAEKRVPLDGRINVKVGSKVIDLRVSTLPTVHGESIVMRILDKESLSLGLPQLGFFTDDQEIFEGV